MKCVIVGGGISGLALAWELVQNSERQHEVVVLEADSRAGGKIGTDRSHGLIAEFGPNGFLDNKPSTLALCRSLGLADQLRTADPAAAHRFLFLGDRLVPLPAKPKKFLMSDLLSLRGRLRVLAERLIPALHDGVDESIQEFGYRRIGREATDILLGALVSGIYAGDPSLLSLKSCFPRIAELEAEYGSLIRAQAILARARRKLGPNSSAGPTGPGGTLHTLTGGMATLIERLQERLGDRVRLRTPAKAIERVGDRWRVVTEQGPIETDQVVLTSSPSSQSRLLQPIDQTLAEEVGGIACNVAVVVCLAYRRSELVGMPIGFGYLSPEKFRRPVLGVIWSTHTFPEQAPPDLFQFRAILGGWSRRDVLDWDDDRLERETRQELAASLRITTHPVHRTIVRWPEAIPQYHVGHAARLARIDARVAQFPGLWLSGNGYRGVAVNDCVAESVRLGQRLLMDSKPIEKFD